jgi:SAM-dependent methyltransferase
MEKSEYRKHYDLEECHWWFRGRRKILLGLLAAFPRPNRPRVWLDAGCGTGFNLTLLSRLGPAFGCDSSEDALAFCRKRGLEGLVQADVQQVPFKDDSFDGASLLDVLYHRAIRNDRTVLEEIHRTLRPGGILLVTDSALNALRSRHDAAVHGRERYTKKRLTGKIQSAGFDIVRASYFNFFLFPAVAAARLGERWLLPQTRAAAPQSDLKRVAGPLNVLLEVVGGVEAALLKTIDFPWGSSIVVLARKKGF